MVDVDKQRANTMDVEVSNLELKAFGTFTWKSTRMAIFISVIFHALKISISIALEKEAAPTLPWTRNLLSGLDWATMTGSVVVTEVCCYTMAGVPATDQMHKFMVIITVGTMLALSYLQLSEFTIFNIGSGLIMQSSVIHYFNTRKAHPDRCFLPHLMWTVACIGSCLERLL